MLGTTPSTYKSIPIAAHFELHIEQGPILDLAGAPVAVVTGVQGFRWFDIHLTGRGQHAGTTPMGFRRDPLSVFSQMVLAAERLAIEAGGLSTIGRVWSEAPQSTNCILDDISFHLDIRHHEIAKLDDFEAAIRREFLAIVDKTEVKLDRWELLTSSDPVDFDAECVSAVRTACKSTVWPLKELISGAGHDS